MTARHGSITDFFLKLSDLALLTASLGLTIVYRYSPSQNPAFVIDYLSERVKVTNAILGFILLLSWYAAFAAQGLYVSHRLSSLRGELREIAHAVAISSLALLVAAQLGKWPTINLLTVGGFGVAGFVFVAPLACPWTQRESARHCRWRTTRPEVCRASEASAGSRLQVAGLCR